MKIQFTKDAEAERLKARPEWEYGKHLSLVAAAQQANKLGWAENKVQVRRIVLDDAIVEYQIEPYEDCKCPDLLRYEDIYGDPPSS